MILNETLDFASTPPDVKRAFLATPERVQLRRHTRLYKWTDDVELEKRPMTPWWSFVESTTLPSGLVAEGFQRSEELARRLNRAHREYAKTRAAISDQFRNSMRHVVVIELNVPAFGFAGRASGQREFADARVDLANVYSIGGACQLWIPHLERGRHFSICPPVTVA